MELVAKAWANKYTKNTGNFFYNLLGQPQLVFLS